MFRFLFFLLLSTCCLGQKLHHQAIASQGANVVLSNKLIVAQSIGQTSVIGNYKNSKMVVGQGYIQSFGITKGTNPVREVVSVGVYPNPVVDVANLKFSSDVGTTATLYLFDSRGRLIYNQQGEPNQTIFTYDLSLIAEGVYFAKIETTNYTFSTKIIKTK